MYKYSLEIQEKSTGYVIIESENEKNADELYDIGVAEYLNGNVVWDNTDYKITNIYHEC